MAEDFAYFVQRQRVIVYLRFTAAVTFPLCQVLFQLLLDDLTSELVLRSHNGRQFPLVDVDLAVHDLIEYVGYVQGLTVHLRIVLHSLFKVVIIEVGGFIVAHEIRRHELLNRRTLLHLLHKALSDEVS